VHVVPVSVPPARPLVDGGSDWRCRRVDRRRRRGGRRNRGGGRGRRRWGRRRRWLRSRSGRRRRRRRRRLAGRALLRARRPGPGTRSACAVARRRDFVARLTRVEGRGGARCVGRLRRRRRLRLLDVRGRMPGGSRSGRDRLAPNHAKPIRGESAVHRASAQGRRRFRLRLGGRCRRLVEQPPQLVVALQSGAPQVAGSDRRGDQAENARRREVELHAASIAGRSDGARDRYAVLSLRLSGVQGGVGALEEPVGRIAFVAGNAEACRVLDADGLR
jgi:hypothetical protein